MPTAQSASARKISRAVGLAHCRSNACGVRERANPPTSRARSRAVKASIAGQGSFRTRPPHTLEANEEYKLEARASGSPTARPTRWRVELVFLVEKRQIDAVRLVLGTHVHVEGFLDQAIFGVFVLLKPLEEIFIHCG